VRITINVDDADGLVERAVARGSEVIMPVQDMFWGARYGKLRDPYGHEWGINQQLEEITPEETEANADKFFASNNR
jgi:uncharacterized glyoxalase superfamily protein PhnB